jgi:hypothetical protein
VTPDRPAPVRAIVRYWPVIGIVGMLLLGFLVGHGSNTLDDWFLYNATIRSFRPILLFFVDARVLIVTFAVIILVALIQKRWRLAALTLVAPGVGLVIARSCKQFFGRSYNGFLAYPSGHTTVMVVVLGMFVLLTGCRMWAVFVAACASVLGILGASVTFHFFTDTVGAVLLGTAVVCGAAQLMHLRWARQSPT